MHWCHTFYIFIVWHIKRMYAGIHFVHPEEWYSRKIILRDFFVFTSNIKKLSRPWRLCASSREASSAVVFSWLFCMEKEKRYFCRCEPVQETTFNPVKFFRRSFSKMWSTLENNSKICEVNLGIVRSTTYFVNEVYILWHMQYISYSIWSISS